MEEAGEGSKGLVGLAEIETAAMLIQDVALRTPLLPSPELSVEWMRGAAPASENDERRGGSGGIGGGGSGGGETGLLREPGEVRLKCESLQPGGSFKIRGASNFIAQLPSQGETRGIITYSSGNHAQAVALAGKVRGLRVVVVMPTTAPAVKVDGARRLGAEVVLEGTTSQHRQARAEAMAAEEGLTVVPPFEHPHIIAGQGTAGLEIVREWPEVELILVPIGGGGLASGTATAAKALSPGVKVVGVEADGAPTMRAALDAGGPVTLERIDTIADGLAPVRAGDLTFRHCREFLDDVVLVKDQALREATAFLLHRRKLVVEFSGAATVAALLSGAVPCQGQKVAAVLSGGNLDPSHLPSLPSPAS